MILDVKTYTGRGCKVYDAEGNYVPHVTRCDTETGEVTRYVELRAVDGEIPSVTETRPAPLRVEPLKAA